MAKDDYYVIVYQILAYLYRTLKDGNDVDPAMLEYKSQYLNINRKYWQYIIENMQEEGYIKGVVLNYAWGNNLLSYDLSGCQITPAGIAYLCDNSTIKKAYRFLKASKEILPFDL